MKTPPGGRPRGHGLRVALLRSCFNAPIVDGLADGARRALQDMGVEPAAITCLEVPGAFELPLAARAAADSGRFDAVVALGAVIRGETDHYEHVAREAAAGLAAIARETRVPVGFGVLTVDEEEQARERSAPGPGNKGAEAARAALTMVDVLRRLGRSTVARGARSAARTGAGSQAPSRPGDRTRRRRRKAPRRGKGTPP